jgi:hypothetical protein
MIMPSAAVVPELADIEEGSQTAYKVAPIHWFCGQLLRRSATLHA